jgi:hypothetical protein
MERREASTVGGKADSYSCPQSCLFSEVAKNLLRYGTAMPRS